ncbi:MAG: hypothetical protein LUC33_02435 [Prevotellaceae bacterium]|nr:hypothetical protein [Prevotellaceae bacterium]
MAVKFIGIKRIWYGEVFTAAVTPATLAAWIKAESTTEVGNSHKDTFKYEHGDPETTDYINELTGKKYYTDKITEGDKSISWTMGAFEYKDLQALMGGTLQKDSDNNVIGWAASTSIEGVIYKGVVAMTKTGNYIVFTNAAIVAKNDTQEKAIGLGITATANDNDTDGVSDEYKYSGDSVDISDTSTTSAGN